MRILLLLFFLVVISPAQIALDTQLTADIANFHTHWDKFVRTYLGCPKDAVAVEDCTPVTGVIDYAEWKAARKAAKKLFGLEERKHAEAK
jgi:flagellar biosynthesis regulator FlbT